MKLRWAPWERYPDHWLMKAYEEDGGWQFAIWMHPHTYCVDNWCSSKRGYVIRLYRPEFEHEEREWEVAAEGIEGLEDAKAAALAIWRMK